MYKKGGALMIKLKFDTATVATIAALFESQSQS